MVLFFKDPNSSHAHEADINMLIRICDVHNVPLATNEADSSRNCRASVRDKSG
jgi:methylglyoxal synthase